MFRERRLAGLMGPNRFDIETSSLEKGAMKGENSWKVAPQQRVSDVPDRLLHIFPSFGIGGVPVRISNVINHFGNRYAHTIISLDGSLDCAARLKRDVDTELLSLSPRGLVNTIREATHVLNSIRPDLFLTYNWGAIEWALANGWFAHRRHVHFESGFGAEEAKNRFRRRNIFRRIALRRAEHIVVPSTTLYRIAISEWHLPTDKVIHVANGVDCTKFAVPPDADLLSRFGISPDDLIVGTVAPLRAEKNLQRMLRVHRQTRKIVDAKLLIVGDGPELPKLRELATALDLADHVVFCGHVENVERLLGRFDVFILTSDTEQMPNTILQAMAAGRAICATDVGDIRIMVASENADYIVPPEDEGQLAHSLVLLLSNNPLRRILGERNQVRAQQKYFDKRMFRAYGQIFDGADITTNDD
jgi:glycosyltransferase involved in cell wall biosynthesis